MMKEIPSLTPGERSAIETFCAQLRETLEDQVLQIKLFGSKAKGDGDADSDLDVLVVVTTATTEIKDNILDIAFEVNLTYDVYISPTIVASDVFEDPIRRITPFIRSVVSEGIPL